MIILRFWIIIQTLYLTRTYSVAPGGGTCTATFCRRSNMWGLLFWKQVKQTFFFLMLLNINYIGWRAMHWHKSSTLFPSPIILKSQFTVDLQQFFPLTSNRVTHCCSAFFLKINIMLIIVVTILPVTYKLPCCYCIEQAVAHVAY